MWINKRGSHYEEARFEWPMQGGRSAYIKTTCDGATLLRILESSPGQYLAYHLTSMCWTTGEFHDARRLIDQDSPAE